jgi:hypothetical protein
MGVLWALVYIGLPQIALGRLIAAGVQLVTGQCVGFWCWF